MNSTTTTVESNSITNVIPSSTVVTSTLAPIFNVY